MVAAVFEGALVDLPVVELLHEGEHAALLRHVQLSTLHRIRFHVNWKKWRLWKFPKLYWPPPPT